MHKFIMKYQFYMYKLDNAKCLSSHRLNNETGRHTNTPRNERKCTFCNVNDIEHEYNFVLICPLYEDIRRNLILSFYTRNPSVFKF